MLFNLSISTGLTKTTDKLSTNGIKHVFDNMKSIIAQAHTSVIRLK